MGTFIHIYFPTSLKKSSIAKNTVNKLVGFWRTSLGSDNGDTKSVISISIIGIIPNPSSSEEFQIGEILTPSSPGTTAGISHSSKPSPFWIYLRKSGISNQILVESVLSTYDNTIVPNSNVLVFQYNPYELQYACPKQMSNIPSIILESFNRIPNCKEIINTTKYLLPNISPVLPSVQVKDVSGDNNKSSEDEIEAKSSIWSYVSKRSCGIQQIIYKIDTMSKVFNFSSQFSSNEAKLEKLNIVTMLILDSCVGILFTLFLMQHPSLFIALHSKIEELLKVLFYLLNWLRGSPAGLKLNAALNSLLWRFFSYHLHLWGNYIGILEPILSLILGIFVKVGFIGVSLQIALFKDIVSIATFHIYCLYIYATRLFSVELIVLKSLGRLFFGRKWNPLRNRVDSVQLSNTEMFVSSLAFTISVFLAPTTIIYYSVFLSLRLSVLIMESFLSYMVQFINSLKVVTKLLILIGSARVTDKAYLSSSKFNENDILTCEIRMQSNCRLFNFPPVAEHVLKVIGYVFSGRILN